MADDTTGQESTGGTGDAAKGEAAQTGQAPGKTATGPEPRAPQWDGDFDPDRAARLVANLRGELAETKGRLNEHEDAQKTEYQRLTDRAAKAEQELADARTEIVRNRIAIKHGLDPELAEMLSGTEQEMEARAAKLVAKWGAPSDTGDTSAEPGKALPARPRPALSPGQSTEPTGPAFDPREVARQARL